MQKKSASFDCFLLFFPNQRTNARRQADHSRIVSQSKFTERIVLEVIAFAGVASSQLVGLQAANCVREDGSNLEVFVVAEDIKTERRRNIRLKKYITVLISKHKLKRLPLMRLGLSKLSNLGV